jgi:hypothetical protein
MTDTMTFKNIDLSSWDTLYMAYYEQTALITFHNSVACSPQANYTDRAAAAC